MADRRIRSTKVVATIGPPCREVATIREMIRAGMIVARLNLSHANHAEHAELAARVREAADELEAEEAWRSASDATLCKVPLGTPEGAGNKFAELARGDEIKRKVRLWWWKHPNKAVTTPEHLESVKRGEVFDKVGKYVVEIGQGECPAGCYVDQRGKIRSDWYDLQALYEG